jgi:hypothetical protein
MAPLYRKNQACLHHQCNRLACCDYSAILYKNTPSDVLGGMALGHFFGAFFTDALLGGSNPERVQVVFEPARDRTLLIVRFSY